MRRHFQAVAGMAGLLLAAAGVPLNFSRAHLLAFALFFAKPVARYASPC
jgi:hypothetical protein